MRKLRLTKVVVPELVAYFTHSEESTPDYRCPECGFGLAEEYSYCPYCGSELDWKQTHNPEHQERYGCRDMSSGRYAKRDC